MSREQRFTVSCNILERFHPTKFACFQDEKQSRQYLVIWLQIKITRLLSEGWSVCQTGKEVQFMEEKSIKTINLFQQLVQKAWTRKSWKDSGDRSSCLSSLSFLFPTTPPLGTEADHPTQHSHSHALTVVRRVDSPRLGIYNIMYKKHNVWCVCSCFFLR